MAEEKALHVYEFDRGGTDWVVAADEADAVAVMKEYLLMTCGPSEELDDDEPTLCDDEKVTGFHHWDDARDVQPLVGDGVHFQCTANHGECIVERRTYSEFARLNGRGFWASTEY